MLWGVFSHPAVLAFRPPTFPGLDMEPSLSARIVLSSPPSWMCRCRGKPIAHGQVPKFLCVPGDSPPPEAPRWHLQDRAVRQTNGRDSGHTLEHGSGVQKRPENVSRLGHRGH